MDAPRIYRLKISLADVDIPIWRTVVIPDTATLDNLHSVIQGVFGWGNYHLHLFDTPSGEYSSPHLGDFLKDEPHLKNSTKVTLREVLPAQGAEITYVYDLGDEWIHDVVLEKIAPPLAGAKYPFVVEGANAAPPEDSGGPIGYSAILAAQGKKDKSAGEIEALEWLGRGFNPKYFDLSTCMKRLTKYAKQTVLVKGPKKPKTDAQKAVRKKKP